MLPILYHDEHFVAIHKPSGLLVHRTILDAHETRFAVQLVREQIGRHVHPVHRLDKGTSGVLLFALDRSVATAASALFEAHRVAKTYLAVVRGHPPASGLIDHPLSRNLDDLERPEERTATAPQAAVTRFETLATVELPIRVDRYPTSRYALVRLVPLTGRRHQLRRHMKHISHPIIGDSNYGKGRHNRMFQQALGSDRLLLHCRTLRLTHPITGTMLEIGCPPADDFTAVIERLGWTAP